jgi:uncharacterized membrane protein YcaP (DUF421 family)
VLFQDWSGLYRTLLVGTLAYISLVMMLRVSGKRTLTKMNAFDLVVTVALGSTLATILLSEDVALAEGVTAFALLVLLQFAVTWLSVRSSSVRKLVKAEPRLLFHNDEFLHHAMRVERVTREEVLAAVRSSGYATMHEVEAVVLETDASFSVIGKSGDRGRSTHETVEGIESHQPSAR